MKVRACAWPTRPALLRWNVDTAFAVMKCEPLPAHWTILDDANYEAHWSPWSRERLSGTDIVLRGNAIEMHWYSGDPREPYGRDLYRDLDEFIRKFAVARACGLHSRDVHFLPELWEGGYPGGPLTNQSVERAAKWAAVVDERKEQQKAYYEAIADRFMARLQYRLVRRLLRR